MIYAHGSGGLLSAPGLGGSLRRKRTKKRTKAARVTVAQLEAYVSSPAYTPDGADALAQQISELPRLKGESLGPGITRIHNNLCNVHGRYGPCDKALSGTKKPTKGKRARKPAKPKKVALTPAQRQQARDATHAQNQTQTLQKLNIAPDAQAALAALRTGDQPDPAAIARGGFEQAGLVDRASDGSFRLTASGRATLNAAQAGDAGRTGDTISNARDRVAARQTRQQAATARHQASQQAFQQRQAQRQARLAKQGAASAPAKALAKAAVSGSSARPKLHGPSSTSASHLPTPAKAPAKRAPVAAAPAKVPVKAPAKQIAPALADAATKLSNGKASDDEVQTLVRNGLAKVGKDGQPILTAAGLRATQKATDRIDPSQAATWTSYSFIPPIGTDPFRSETWLEWRRAELPGGTLKVFKDARGDWRWVAYSSTAYRDRDDEIVSTKALADDCDRADGDGAYGPLRYWHTPGIELGDCDFNVIHGRVLIESGTFRSKAIAMKVARKAADSEISIGYLHPPTEPDAYGVFHHIRRFERSLVPRGKASNRFTALTVKEPGMATLEERWEDAKKQYGFTDSELKDIQTGAEARQKAADDQGVAYKATESATAPMPGQRFKVANGEEYIKSPSDLDPTGMYYATKAFPPKAAADSAPAEGSPAEEAAETPEEEAAEPDAGMDDDGLTLSPGDFQAMRQELGIDDLRAQVAALAQAIDVVKTMGAHVDKFNAAIGTQQATKDAEQAETKQQLTALAAQVAALKGDQPATPYRASAAADTILSDATLLAAVKSQQPGAGPWDDIITGLGLTRPAP